MYYGDGSDMSCFPFPLAVGEASPLFRDCNNLYIVDIKTVDFSLDLSIGQGPWTQVYTFRGHGRQLEVKRFSSIIDYEQSLFFL